jgi:hypothetical protein
MKSSVLPMAAWRPVFTLLCLLALMPQLVAQGITTGISSVTSPTGTATST